MLRDLPCYETLQEKARRYPQLEADAVEATLVLMRVTSDVLDGLGAHLARCGTGQGRFLVLILLDRPCVEGAMSPSELAHALDVTRANVTGLVDGLEKEGLVERQRDETDRRAQQVHLTAAGREFLHAMLPEHYERIAGLMAHLSPAERRQLTGLLVKVARGLGALRDEEWKAE